MERFCTKKSDAFCRESVAPEIVGVCTLPTGPCAALVRHSTVSRIEGWQCV